MHTLSQIRIAIIGLGYVGLPLAVLFSKKFPVVGFDVNQKRISELREGKDNTLEISSAELNQAKNLFFADAPEMMAECNVFIVTVPTPINQHNHPNLMPLMTASRLLGNLIKKNDVVIFESTVYPGATEEECIPVIEEESGLVFNKDFFAGYSPERINPGDKNHRVENIVKVTSGSTNDTGKFVNALYASVVKAGTFLASSIKVAEAAKVIENTQRDVNIALINELAIIFEKLNIDTHEVLEAAGTKWNFLPFKPGLVGGHCIGVDPYYLTHKAQSIGYHPEMILAGRRINDGMSTHVVSRLVKKMIMKKIQVDGSRVLIMGLTFKENCPDLRNTKIIDIISELEEFKMVVDVIDPWCSKEEAQNNHNITIKEMPEAQTYDAIILAVGHEEFKATNLSTIRSWGKESHILFDLKYFFAKEDVDMRL